jgi:hypothetical protein
MRFKFKGCVESIHEDTFWAEILDGPSAGMEFVEILKSAIPEEEKHLLFNGAFFTFYSDKGIVFGKETYTKEELEAAKKNAEEIYKILNELAEDVE